ncbi:MAG: CapA family protein [Alkalimonas sp.]|nr:CapA family protein [Alkalimonas sp.]
MIKIAFAGDLCLSSIKHASDTEISAAFKDIYCTFEPYDLSICNLECSFSLSPVESINMNIPIDRSPSLKGLGIEVFCLANNHVKDSGPAALSEMQDFIKQSDCLSVGAGSNVQTANSMLTLEKGGLIIGVLNVTDASHYGAGENEPGVAVLKKKKLLDRAHKLSKQVDALVVIIHADLEFTNYPAPWRVQLSRELAKYCKVVIHHHSHTLQGIEVHAGCVIAYSLGNFVFPIHRSTYMKNRAGNVDEGMALVVSLDKQNGRIEAKVDEIIPTRIGTNGFLRGVTEKEKYETLQNIDKYSDALSNSYFLRRHHFRLCRAQLKKFLMGIYYTYSKHGLKRAMAYIRVHFSTDQHRNWMKSFFTLGFF